MSPLITPASLRAELAGSQPPLLIDARPAHEFSRGLIDGAVHFDVWGMSLNDTSDAPLRAFMWMIGHLCALRGIAPDRPVVVYEQHSGVRAARVFWFLEYLGHPNARVLDGGIDRWTREGLPLTRDAAAPAAGTWHGTPTPGRLAAWSEVQDVLGDDSVAIVDTRSREEYLGKAVRALRGGAIPGAINIEWTQNLASDGCYKTVEELRALYVHAGVTPDKTVVTYCQGGYRAAHTYLALRILDFPRVRNYTGSWKEWGDREDLPIEYPGGTV
ncbi:MAG: sulfurtransferase [Acidobacteriota bacterium]